MSGILAELQQLVNLTVPPVLGTVESLDGSSIVVVSSQGVKRFWVPSVSVYSKGDRVRFQGEVLLGKVAPETSIPYYRV